MLTRGLAEEPWTEPPLPLDEHALSHSRAMRAQDDSLHGVAPATIGAASVRHLLGRRLDSRALAAGSARKIRQEDY